MKAVLPAAVAGGGIVGLAAALLLNRRCGWQVALVEPSPPRNGEGRGPQRALTLSPGAAEVLAECGLQPGGSAPPGNEGVPPSSKAGTPSFPGGTSAFPGETPPIPGGQAFQVPCHEFSRMVVWHGEGGPRPDNGITFDAAELGMAALGCVAHESPARRALWQLAEQCPGIRLHSGAALKSVEITEERGVLRLDDCSEIAAELLVGADGGNSLFRQALGIGFDSQGYGQRGLVFEAESGQSGGETAWQHFIDGGTLALLPLGETRWSIVWSVPEARAEHLQNLNENDLKAALDEASAGVAGVLTPATSIASFPLRRGYAARTSGERYALVGEAARTVHPLAGQGLNLGIADADALARVCAEQGEAEIGDARILSRFARERTRFAHEMSFGIHTINTAFTTSFAPLASRAMSAVDRLPPLKRYLASRAMR